MRQRIFPLQENDQRFICNIDAEKCQPRLASHQREASIEDGQQAEQSQRKDLEAGILWGDQLTYLEQVKEKRGPQQDIDELRQLQCLPQAEMQTRKHRGREVRQGR